MDEEKTVPSHPAKIENFFGRLLHLSLISLGLWKLVEILLWVWENVEIKGIH
ncbi:MAG: hypothetical protein HC836_24175 [Richelia sp. RM2_1_2]|nr:hypothetical protein [Richelia sp. RM2_1_2]